MHFIYIDDSKEPPLYTFSAIAIPDDEWRNVFDALRMYRRDIRDSDGIYIRKELHARNFVAGRGKISDREVGKYRRSVIFKSFLSLLAEQPGVRLFNVAHLGNEMWAFERLVNRINRTMRAWGSRAILICDEGKENQYRKLIRRMGVYNPIPSRYGVWQDTGESSRNIPIARILQAVSKLPE